MNFSEPCFFFIISYGHNCITATNKKKKKVYSMWLVLHEGTGGRNTLILYFKKYHTII